MSAKSVSTNFKVNEAEVDAYNKLFRPFQENKSPEDERFFDHIWGANSGTTLAARTCVMRHSIKPQTARRPAPENHREQHG